MTTDVPEQPVLDLPLTLYAPKHFTFFPSVRWLGQDKGVRCGFLLRAQSDNILGLVFDPLRGEVTSIHEGEYESNVQKDNAGNPVTP